ncbi:MAG: ATP-binding protein [bacterium]
MEKRKSLGLDKVAMRSLFDGLLKNMNGGVFAVDRDMTIQFFSKAAEWITGYSREEVLGKPCREIFKAKVCEDGCPFERVIKKGIPIKKMSMVIIGKYGSQIAISRTAFRLEDTKGKTTGMAAIFRDTTELQNLRQQLLQSEKLAVMGQLAAGVAHEINNPINGIITYIRLLLKKLDENKVDPKTWKKNLELVERETKRIGRLVKNLLNFSRKTEPEFRPLSLKYLIEETLPLLHDQFLLKNVTLTKKYGNTIPDILGDPNQLQQVLLNLILNAIQAVEDQGRVSISLDAEGKSFVHLDIWDNGVGIPQEDLDKLFDPFFTSKTGKQAGVGLGLSIVKKIVTAHNGRIRIQSELDKGTDVSIRFPTL